MIACDSTLTARDVAYTIEHWFFLSRLSYLQDADSALGNKQTNYLGDLIYGIKLYREWHEGLGHYLFRGAEMLRILFS